MDNFLLAIKPTFPDAQMLQSQVSSSANLAVIETSFLTLRECACNQFHFLIPLRQAPVIRTENKLYTLKAMSVFPCNPMQPHQVADTGIVDFRALILYVEKTFLQSVAKDLFGYRSLELKNSCFAFSPALQELTQTFIRECSARQPGYALMLESLSVQAAILLLRESSHKLSFSAIQSGVHRDNKCIVKAIEYITDNYQNKMSLFELASVTNYSPYHLLRLFKQHTGKTPFEFLLDVKVEKAKMLLRKTDYTITEICNLTGFSSNSYFSQVFKKKMGVSPSQYKSNL